MSVVYVTSDWHHISDTRYFNACVEQTRYAPMAYQQIISYLQGSTENK